MSPKEIRMPYIHLQSEDAKLVNEVIHGMFKNLIEVYKEALEEAKNGDTPFFTTSDYMFTQAKDFLSVLIIRAEHGATPTMYNYRSFNFKLGEKGKRMDSQELMEFTSADADKLKNYLINHIHEKIKAFRTLYATETASDRDVGDSIEKLEQDHQKWNYTFFIENKNKPKTLTLFYSYIDSPAGDSSIHDILKITDTGNSQLVQSAIDNVSSYPGKPLAIAIRLPMGENLNLFDKNGKKYRIIDFRKYVEQPSENLYIIPLEEIKILVKDIE